MIVLSGALVLVALVLLVFGAIDRNLPYVYGSIGVSLLSLLLLFVGILQRRGELTGDEPDEAATPVTDATAEPVPALVGAGAQEADSRTAELAVPAPAPAEPEQPASRRVAPDAAPDAGLDPGDEDVLDEADDEADDEDFDEPDDDEPDGEGSGVTVLVVSGRPRYHLEGCRVLRGKDPEPLDRDDARMHGFTPCGVCKPDADETEAAPAAGAESFTEALFGGPLFADASDGEVERVPTSELPGRPVQPVLTEVEPPAAQDEPGPAAAPTVDDDQEPPAEPLDAEQPEPPAELRGDDPADDPTVGPDDTPAAEPSPDVAANPDEVVEPALSADASGPAVEDDVTDEPVHAEEPVEVAPVRASSRRSTGRRSPQTGAAVEQAPVATTVAEQEAPLEGAPAGTAPAKKSPAKKAPAKKAPAKKAPAKKTPAKRAPAEAAAERAPSRAAAAKAQAAVEAPAAPAVKRPVVRAVRADALRLGAPSTGGTTTRVSARGAAPTAGPPVVVVPDRDRFHRPDCRYVRGVAGATALPKASASRQGYSACGVCKP